MRKLYVLFAAIIAVPLVVTGTSLRAQTTGLWDVYNTVFTFKLYRAPGHSCLDPRRQRRA